MNFIIWNCRGTASKGFPILIKDMPYRYNSNFCVLLETHISGNKAKNIIKKLDFDSWCISEAVGFAGGIWCLWNKVFWSIEPVSIQDQLIHMKIRDSANNIWWFTAVYSSPHLANRRRLWSRLEELALNIREPWCIGGDFNSILSLDDTRGSTNLSQDHDRFYSCINKLCNK
ncbi:hypothetical protein AHAS_Ahas17G0076800 [Arachis hypogaea]